MTVNGQDWASYQPATPSTKGLDFVFIKVTEGTGYTNPKWKQQRDTARHAGLLVGYYHYAQGVKNLAEADHFLDQTGPLLPGEMLGFDWEDSDVSNAEKDAWIKYVQGKMPAHRVVLYCNLTYWLRRDSTSYCGDGLWIADPSAPAGHPRVEHPWTFHQYSSAGGIDRNVGNFASPAALRAWAAKGTTSAPPPVSPPKEHAVTKSVAPQIVDLPPIGDIGTTDPKTPSGRKEYGAGYYYAHLLDEARKQTALLTDIKAALAAKES